MGRHPQNFTQTDSCIAARKLYSITSSARASIEGGTVRPSALAVFRLITSSYLVGACTGKLPGFFSLQDAIDHMTPLADADLPGRNHKTLKPPFVAK